MSYPAGTILVKTEPVQLIEDEDGKPVNAVEFSLNKLRIIGPSPVRGAEQIPQWEGIEGDLYIVRPVDVFAANQVAPDQALRKDYDVDSYPDDSPNETEVDPAAARRARLESPEDVFAKASREDLKAKKATPAKKAAIT